MSNENIAAVAAPVHPGSLSALGRFLAFGAAAGVVAAAAAHVSTFAAVPVWAMFMGWIAWFTRGHSARDGLINWICLALGIGIGFGATALLGLLAPVLGNFALPFVVFAVALLVVSTRILPALSNIPGYFLGGGERVRGACGADARGLCRAGRCIGRRVARSLARLCRAGPNRAARLTAFFWNVRRSERSPCVP